MRNNKIIIFSLITSLTILNATSLDFIGIEKSKKNQIKEVKKSVEETPTKNSNSWEKIKTGVQNFVKKKNEILNKMEDTINNSGIPIKFKTEETKVMEGTVSWSLVNDKCQIDPKAIFQKSLKNLVDKYKQIWNQLKDKGFWEMYAINKLTKLVCNVVNYKECAIEGGYLKYMDVELAKAKFNDCVQKETKGMINLNKKGSTGTTTVAAGMAPGGGAAPISNPTSSYFVPCGCIGCPPCGMPFTFPHATHTTEISIDPIAGKGISICYNKIYGNFYITALHKCFDAKLPNCLKWINGKIDLGMKLNLGNFKIEQQACILKKYNMRIEIEDVINDLFELKKKDSKNTVAINVKVKNSFVFKPKNFEDTRKNIINYKNSKPFKEVLKENKLIFKRYNFNKYQYYYSIISYLNYLSWKVAVFGNFGNYKKYIDNNNEITYNDGRWDFDTFNGFSRKKLLDDDSKYNTSILKECNNILISANQIETADDTNRFFIFYEKLEPSVYKEAINGKLKIKVVPVASEIINSRNAFATMFTNLYTTTIKLFPNTNNYNLLNSYLNSGVPIYDLIEISNMLKTCLKWATETKYKIEKESVKFNLKKGGVLIKLNKKNQKPMKELAIKILQMQKEMFQNTDKALDTYINSATETLKKIELLKKK